VLPVHKEQAPAPHLKKSRGGFNWSDRQGDQFCTDNDIRILLALSLKFNGSFCVNHNLPTPRKVNLAIVNTFSRRLCC
jgi:hypothetical protein